MRKYTCAILCFVVSQSLFAQWSPSGSNIYYNGGSVGIGTSSPGGKLNIYNPGAGTILHIGNPNSGSGGYTTLSLGTSVDIGGYTWLQGIKNSGSAYGDFIINASGGNVGIGTANPSARLDVNGSISTNSNLHAGGNFDTNGDLEIGRGDGQDTKLRFHNYNSGWYSMGIDMSDGKFKINAGGVLGQTNMFNMDWLGNVGIGISNPQNKLDVNGTIHTKEVKVDLNNWPDYVFNKEYSLQPLSEVKQYIDQNGHLPEMPSAKEVETDGLQLGQMNALLLKKIEELTLHVIRQQEEIEQLKRALKNE